MRNRKETENKYKYLPDVHRSAWLPNRNLFQVERTTIDIIDIKLNSVIETGVVAHFQYHRWLQKSQSKVKLQARSNT